MAHIEQGKKLGFGIHKDKTPEEIIASGNESYLAFLLKNNIKSFQEDIKNYMMDWAQKNPKKWNSVRLSNQGKASAKTKDSKENSEEKKEYVVEPPVLENLSDERQASWGSW